MVRLSKPGQQADYVSYLDKIDDENVLKGLEALRRRAMGVTTTGAPQPTLPTNTIPHIATPNRTTKDAVTSIAETSQTRSLKMSVQDSPMTTQTVSTSASSTGSRTPGLGTPKARNVGTSPDDWSPQTPSKTTQGQESPPAITNALISSQKSSEFVPKWKLEPKIEPPSIPRWQLETAAQERAAAEQAKVVKESPTQTNTKTDEHNIAKKSEMSPDIQTPPQQIEVPNDANSTTPQSLISDLLLETTDISPQIMQNDPLFGNSFVGTINAIEVPAGLLGSHNRVHKTESRHNIREGVIGNDIFRNDRDEQSLEDYLDATMCDETILFDNFIANSVKMSSFFDRLGCFGMVDQIIEPPTDFEENFTYCTVTEASDTDGSFDDNSEWESTGSTCLDTAEVDDEAAAVEFLTQRGFGELAPMISMLATFKYFIARGTSDPMQLQYISNLLAKMEDKLQDYGGYRRRSDKNHAEKNVDFTTLSHQIDELNKLILRIVEDFIDERLFEATNVEVASLPSAFSDGDVESFFTGNETRLGEESYTVQEDSFSEQDHTETGNASLMISKAASPTRKYLPSFFSRSFSTKSNESSKLRDAASISSFGLTKGNATFISADKFVQNKKLRSVPTNVKCDPGSVRKGQRTSASSEVVSLTTSQTSSSRTHVMRNVSKLFSRSPKRESIKAQLVDKEGNKATEKVHRLEDTIFVAAPETSSPGLPPLDPKSFHGKSQASPARRLFGGKRMAKRRSSSGSETRIFLHETVDDKNSTVSGIESVVQMPSCSGMSFVDTVDTSSVNPNSVIIFEEVSDLDNEQFAIESIVGIAATPLQLASA